MQDTEYKLLDWHIPLWRQLWAPAAGLPHALLLTGPEGIGKSTFALALAARLLCESPEEGMRCGKCPSCHWFATDNHPDFRHVFPEADAADEDGAQEGEKKKGSRQIRIDQIRALEDFVFVGGHRNGARVVVLEPADTMNVAAANALLKILEEPPSSVYFILVSSRWRRLLPTILSRCRVLKLGRPPTAAAMAWLAREGTSAASDLLSLMGGAPLLALREAERGRGASLGALMASLADPGRDPLALAARWESQLQAKNDGGLSMETLVDLVQKWVFDLAQQKLASRSRFAVGQVKAASGLAAKATAHNLIRCYNDLLKMRALAAHPLNPRLYLEDMAERYLRALAIDRS